MTAIEILRGALALLDEHEWCQFQYADGEVGTSGNTAFSLDGALRHAAGHVAYTVVDGELMEACRLVMSVVLGEIDPQKEDDHYGALLVEWNDAKERAKGDVIDVLRQAIARAEVGS